MSTKEAISLLNKWKCPHRGLCYSSNPFFYFRKSREYRYVHFRKPEFQLEILGRWQAPGNRRVPAKSEDCPVHHINTPYALTDWQVQEVSLLQIMCKTVSLLSLITMLGPRTSDSSRLELYWGEVEASGNGWCLYFPVGVFVARHWAGRCHFWSLKQALHQPLPKILESEEQGDYGLCLCVHTRV